jgi:anti-sigma-K factor RskA
VPSSADYRSAGRQPFRPLQTLWSSLGFWPSTIRIVILEILVLLALAGAVVFYLNWSSEVAVAEFLAASKTQAAPNSSLHAVKGHAPCDRSA